MHPYDFKLDIKEGAHNYSCINARSHPDKNYEEGLNYRNRANANYKQITENL